MKNDNYLNTPRSRTGSRPVFYTNPMRTIIEHEAKQTQKSTIVYLTSTTQISPKMHVMEYNPGKRQKSISKSISSIWLNTSSKPLKKVIPSNQMCIEKFIQNHLTIASTIVTAAIIKRLLKPKIKSQII